MSNWVGYAVSVNCGETLGCYQGTILEVNGATITLKKAFRNGFPYPKSQVTLNAADIKDLRIISARVERERTHSALPAADRRARATVCETLQANPTSTGNQTSTNAEKNNGKSPNIGGTVQPLSAARSKPVDIQGSSKNNGKSPNIGGTVQPLSAARSKPVDIQGSSKNNNHAGSFGSGSTPTSRGYLRGRGESTGIPGPGGAGLGAPPAPTERARRRDEACFGDAAQPARDIDFDFEGNLALFDKRAVWASLRHSKPDLVPRGADECKYRHDENVLGGGAGAGTGAGAEARRMAVPAELRAGDYVTDGGCVVPCVGGAVRKRLWEALVRHGLGDFAFAMVARATCDVALRLVGGGRRLEARNAHQAPRVVALCGAHRGGAAGLAAARLLAARGALVEALVAGAAPHCAALERELAALALDDVPVRARAQDLREQAPDLVLVALYDPLTDNDLAQYDSVVEWWGARRGVAVCVEPAGGGWRGGGARACVLGGLPVPVAPALGRVYLADVAAPQRLYKELRLRFRAPMGALPALALHPRADPAAVP